MTYALLNKLTAKPGKREQVVELLLTSGKQFDDVPECQLYLVAEDVQDPNVIWVSDLWTSRESHQAALARPELRPYVEKAITLLEGMPEQTELRPVGGKVP